MMRRPHGRGLRAWSQIYGLALRLLPPRIRARRSAEMRACFEDRLAEAARRGRFATASVALAELMDVMAAAVRLRLVRGRAVALSTPLRASGMDLLRQDVAYTIRGWLRRPGFALIAVLTLALGIGANTAMFSVADAVVFRPLPHDDPDRLVMVWSVIPGLDWERAPHSYPNFRDLRAESRAFDDLAAYAAPSAASVDAGDGPERLTRSAVTPNLFGLLGNRALAGRILVEADGAPGAERVAVVSETYARTRLGGVAAAVGRRIRIGGEPHVVAGVMSSRFSFPRAGVDAWTPVREEDAAALERDLRFLQLVGRLVRDVTPIEAGSDVARVSTRLAAAYPDANAGMRLWVERRHAFVVGDTRPILMVLLGAVALVLVIACANLANLLLARGVSRSRELAVRAALGAGRRRIVRQLLTESTLLGLAGGAAGAALAWATSGGLQALAASALPRGETIGVDARALLFTTAVAIGCGLLVGLLPALRFGANGSPLREHARGGTGGRRSRRLQSALVVTQIALALVLLVGAGLLVNSLSRLLTIDPGFEPEGVLTLHIDPPESRYPGSADAGRFVETLIERVGAMPGVANVGAVWAVPFSGQWASGGASPQTGAHAGEPSDIGILPVRGDAIGALGLRLVSGRWYTEADRASDAGVVVINEALARRFWPGGDAVGRRFRRGGAEEQKPWQTVIGVVADVKRSDLGAPAQPEAYFLHTHPEGQWARDMNLVVRTSGDPLAIASSLRRTVRALDPEVALAAVQTLPELVERSAAAPRIRTFLAASFAALASLLAVVGIHAVIAFGVAERRREIGLRIALGARSRNVVRDVLRRGASLAAIGIAIGIAGALAASRLLSSVLFGVEPLDMPTYAAVTVLLAGAAFVACWIPASRASRTDPMITLRED